MKDLIDRINSTFLKRTEDIEAQHEFLGGLLNPTSYQQGSYQQTPYQQGGYQQGGYQQGGLTGRKFG